MKIPLLIVQFGNEIMPQEIQLFRGAVVASLNEITNNLIRKNV